MAVDHTNLAPHFDADPGPGAPPSSMATYKVVVVGNGGVGKSALSVRFIQGSWLEKYDPTIEANYRKQVDVDGDPCILDILDTAGQEEYSVLREQYMRMGEGFVLVYNITSPQTFAAINKFHAQAKKFARVEPVCFIVGNKTDLEADRAVTTQEGRELANSLGCSFVESSAKNNTGVSEIFMGLLRAMHQARTQIAKDGSSKKKKKGGCQLL
eukprot:m51a1_g11301 putative ras gtpase (212) ;mRNA; r:69334-70941